MLIEWMNEDICKHGMVQTDWERIKYTEEKKLTVLVGEVQLNTSDYLM